MTGQRWTWTADQEAVLDIQTPARKFVRGMAGTGKTQAAVERLRRLLFAGVAGHTVSIWTPQPLLAQPYLSALRAPDMPSSSDVQILTFGGLSRRMTGLFWPMVAQQAGFRPDVQPTFLDSEAAQWAMAKVVEPLMSNPGFFETVRLPRSRIYGQILDNMNKSALVGFNLAEIGSRLSAAWVGDKGQLRMYDDVQTAASTFRKYCLEHGLLDYSLTVDLFMRHVWPLGACQRYVMERARHIIYDNCEEDVPAAHRVMSDLIENCESAVVLFDEEASYRRFLGADEFSGFSLRNVCDSSVDFETPIHPDNARQALIQHFGVSFAQRDRDAVTLTDNPMGGIERASFRFFPQMIDDAAERVAIWVGEEGILPENIALVVPYLSDALRFALTYRLGQLGMPSRSLRPSRPLRLEPSVRCLMTLAQMAHPGWGMLPPSEDVAHALTTAVEGLDPVRAALLASSSKKGLTSFERLIGAMQDRITFTAGERYERLRGWMEGYQRGQPIPLDHFFSRLYGEILAQPGFNLHGDLDAAQAVAALVDSAATYRQIGGVLPDDLWSASVYLEAVIQGVLGQRSLSQPEPLDSAGVLIAPAYTFLMTNRQVERQIWLDIGSPGWTERLSQPLAHPYVLSLQWPSDQTWTAVEENITAMQSGYRLVAGLLRRCSGTVVMTASDYGEQGMQQQGNLLTALGRILRRTQMKGKNHAV